MSISLRPSNYVMRSNININIGSFRVTRVKRWFSAKMLLLLQNTGHYLLYITIHVTHKYAFSWDSLLHSYGQGQLRITSAGRVRHLWWQMSSFVLFCLFHKKLVWYVFFCYPVVMCILTKEWYVSWVVYCKKHIRAKTTKKSISSEGHSTFM